MDYDYHLRSDYSRCVFSISVQTLKKKKKEEANRKNAKIGDEITTIGGIVGRIVAVKDESDTIIIETGTDRQRLRLKRWAISSVETPLDRVQQAATESSENKPAEKKRFVRSQKKRRNQTRNKRRKIIFSFFVHHKISFV